MNNRGFIGGVSLGFILILCIVFLGISTVRVPAGYVAVQYNMSGGVKGDVLTQGWHLKSPTTKTTLYTVGIEQSYLTSGEDGDSKNDESFSASSSEGKAITIDMTFTYQYNQEDVANVFTKFKGQSGKEVRDSFIKPNIISWTKEVIARHKVSDILGEERADINVELTDYLAKKFEHYGITISNASLINIEVDEETQKAINAKITAQQNAETQAIQNQIAIDKANADAEVARTNAQAIADARLIEAESEAAANKMVSESLTNQLIENKKIETWNGSVPMVTGGSTPIIDLNDLAD